MKPVCMLSCSFILIFTTISFSQDEIKNYTPPEVSKGSSLILYSYPNFQSASYTDGDNESYLNLNFAGAFTKWRFTNKLVYAGFIDSRAGCFVNHTNYSKDTTVTELDFNTLLNFGIDYYLFNSSIYTGFYDESNLRVTSGLIPYSYTYLYPHIGYGHLVDANQITQTLNIEKDLLDEKIIKKPLPYAVKKKLTELLDRRNNNEFSDKYKDNADIEFFTQLESLLLKEGIINSPLNARTSLELFQKLTNSNFIYFPKFNGYQFQTELVLDFVKTNGSFDRNFKSVAFSGVYGIPIGLKTDLGVSAYVEIPLVNQTYHYYRQNGFHSPLLLQENQQMLNNTNYFFQGISISYINEKYHYLFGTNIFGFYNLSATAGLKCNINYSYGKKYEGDVFSLKASGDFEYNILTKMRLSTGLSFLKDKYWKYYINLSAGILYYIF